MAVWVDCTAGTGWFGGSWAADMGAWTGAWPMMPTGVLTGLVDGDEIDFVIGLPNPGAPTNPVVALDGSYDSQVWDAWRRVDSTAPANGSYTGWFTGSEGSATAPGPTDTPPAGYHLYVVSYAASQPPGTAPEGFVPAGYTALGAATVQTNPGGWSAWQTGLPVSGTAAQTIPTGWVQDETVTTSGSSGSITGNAQTAIDASIAASSFGAGLTTTEFDIEGSKIGASGLDPGGTTAVLGPVGGGPGQNVAAYTPSTSNPYPLGAMTGDDLDYGQEFWVGDTYEFVGVPVVDSWGAVSGVTNTFYHGRSGTGAATNVTTAWRVQELTSLPAAGSAGLAAGSTLADVSVGGAGTPTGSDPTGTTFSGLTVTAAGGALYLLLTPAFLFDGAGSVSFPNIAADGVWGMHSQITLDSPLAYDATTGLWRYWLPNTIGPAGVKWHTVGGHWATVGGATLQILTPGVGWVDVVDGPA